MEEVVQSLVQSGQLIGPPGSYSAQQTITKLEVPAVQSVIAARIGQLQERDRWALQIAAVIGREIPVDLLGRITGFDHGQLESSLACLQRAGFISEKQVFPAGVYIFRHSLIEDVAYRSLVGSTRCGIHRRVLELMEIGHAEHLERSWKACSLGTPFALPLGVFPPPFTETGLILPPLTCYRACRIPAGEVEPPPPCIYAGPGRRTCVAALSSPSSWPRQVWPAPAVLGWPSGPAAGRGSRRVAPARRGGHPPPDRGLPCGPGQRRGGRRGARRSLAFLLSFAGPRC
jgi:hypothetical protein